MPAFNKILVLGAKGQVGGALMALLGDYATGLHHEDADLSCPDIVPALLDRYRPNLVINAAAYTNVEKAESEPELANRVNGETPGALAEWCARHQVPFVHYSTDYVFAASLDRPHVEDDPVGPMNAYGRSKLEGEQRVQAAGGQFLLFRTSWLYDACGQNFFCTMVRLARERETVRVVNDQVGAPTYAPHLAARTLEALQSAVLKPTFPSGIYHLCHGGTTTWFGFAEAIFNGLKTRGVALALKAAEPILTSEYKSAVTRPLDSRLDTGRAAAVLGIRLPDWSVGLDECLEVYTCK